MLSQSLFFFRNDKDIFSETFLRRAVNDREYQRIIQNKLFPAVRAFQGSYANLSEARALLYAIILQNRCFNYFMTLSDSSHRTSDLENLVFGDSSINYENSAYSSKIDLAVNNPFLCLDVLFARFTVKTK